MVQGLPGRYTNRISRPAGDWTAWGTKFEWHRNNVRAYSNTEKGCASMQIWLNGVCVMLVTVFIAAIAAIGFVAIDNYHNRKGD